MSSTIRYGKASLLTSPNAKFIRWQYRHYFNSRSSGIRVKYGVYLGKCRHTKIHWRKNNAEQMAWVIFVGNRTITKVPYDEVRFIDREEFEAKA